MAYTVNKTNNSASPNQYTVQDGVVNNQTDLSFIGKGYAGYGELIGENFLKLFKTDVETFKESLNGFIDLMFHGVLRTLKLDDKTDAEYREFLKEKSFFESFDQEKDYSISKYTVIQTLRKMKVQSHNDHVKLKEIQLKKSLELFDKTLSRY